VLRRSKPIRIGVLLLINAALLWLCEFNAGVILDHLGLTAEKTRIFNAGNGRDNSFIVQYDERLGYRLTPRAEAPDRFADSVGRTVSLAKADGVFRILCLGGSTTYGVGADKTNAYPAQLEDLLTRVYGGCGKAFEVLNVGVMGYHSWHSRLRFETELAALRPDLVLVMDAVNDLAASTAIDDSLAFDQEKDRLLHLTNAMDRQDVLAKVDTVLGERSNLYQLLRALGRKVVIVAQAGAADEAAAARERIERFGYRDNMRALVEAARSAGADCVLVDYPWLAATSLPPDAAAVTRRASTPLYRFGRSYFPETNGRVARETAATVINPQPAFDALLAARPSRAGDLYFDEIHLTKYGNQILARQILDQLPQAPAFARFVAGCVPADADNAVKLDDPRIHFANGWPRPGDKPVRLALAAAEGVARDAEEYPGHVRLAPSDPARPGVVRLRAAPGGALQPMPHAAYNAFWYPRVACDTDRVEVLLRDRTLVALSGTKACRFTEAASRYGVDLPELRPGETLEVRLYGRAQVWLTGDKLFFAGDAAHPGY
jgi:lysophospholipase L1-like esterase